ncbi:MAG TPA: 16S rRNA (cytosine(1402)-N(4))-methyltransferase RsmH [Rhizomicrobium sp.]|jgi:16S rRNA (cytosine1402-N4)-methyltransferase|nr:16S rRNA (cytosine(1402)-N(4))-methyltransferase RsmH [Rhizomicrobium sp.]
MSGNHIPVLIDEVLRALAPRDGAHYVDGTFGGGGHARAILERAQCRVLGIDRDPEAIRRGATLAQRYRGRLVLAQGRYSAMQQILAQHGENGSDGVLLDLGVSSFQLDEAGRGFSFRNGGPLDMRMEQSGRSAADFVNTAAETELVEVIAELGEERHARRVARAIVAARPLNRTDELAAIVAEALGPAAARQRIHPATRTFQALRLYINDELVELERGLAAAERVLRPRGRLAVVSFHSLEDRVVKRFLAARAGRVSAGSRHVPDGRGAAAATFRLLPSRTPGEAELAQNPRSRSARLRAAERTSVLLAA